MKKVMINTKKINSLIISLILMTPAIITFLSSAYEISISLSTISICVILIALFIFSLLINKKVNLSFSSIIVIILLFILYMLTILKYKEINYSIFQLVFYVMLPIIISQQDINIKKVLEYILLLSFPLVFGINKMLALENVGLNQSNMYNTFCFIPSVVSMLIYVFLYSKSMNKKYLPLLILNIYYLLVVSITAVRGFWLVIIFFVFLNMYMFFQKRESKKTYTLILLISIVLFIISIFYIDKITLVLLNLAELVFGSNVGIIIKTRALLQRGDVFNGRFQLWLTAIDFIKANPVKGYGFESFARLTYGKYPYPHNFILQLILDCGIIGIIPLINILKSIIYFFENKISNNDNKIFLLLLLTITVPILLFSNNIWKYSSLWILYGFFTRIKGEKYEQN